MCSLVCRTWAKTLRQPSAVWSRLSIPLPVRDAVCSWVKQRAPAVESIDIFGIRLLAQEAESISSMLQMERLLDILASSGASLTSLRLAADNIQSVNAASQVSLASVWPDMLSFTGLQSLALLDNENSNHIACDLADLTVPTGLTSLWLQQGQTSPHGGDPTTQLPLPIDFDDFEYVLNELNLQCLTLANIQFNTDLDTFWESTSLHKLKHLRLDYITFDGFDHFNGMELVCTCSNAFSAFKACRPQVSVSQYNA